MWGFRNIHGRTGRLHFVVGWCLIINVVIVIIIAAAVSVILGIMMVNLIDISQLALSYIQPLIFIQILYGVNPNDASKSQEKTKKLRVTRCNKLCRIKTGFQQHSQT